MTNSSLPINYEFESLFYITFFCVDKRLKPCSFGNLYINTIYKIYICIVVLRIDFNFVKFSGKLCKIDMYFFDKMKVTSPENYF